MVWTRRKPISLAAQAGHLRKWFPDSRASIRRSCLTWIGDLRPGALSQCYTVRLRYKLDQSLDVDLVQPALQERDGQRPPHLYPKDRLCLYLPGMSEWTGEMLLADTIIPWTSEWLFHYEIWLATGEWCGGGEHPDLTPTGKAEQETRPSRRRRDPERPWDSSRRPR